MKGFSPKFIFYAILKEDFPNGVTEYKFHPTRKWKFDYAIPDIKVAFEYEGGVFSKGHGHLSCNVYSKNCEKYNQAALLCWRVFRFTNPMVADTNMFSDLICKIKEESND